MQPPEVLCKKGVVKRFAKLTGKHLCLSLVFTKVAGRLRSSMCEGVLRNLTKFTGKHLCQSLFFNKVANLRPATLLKQRLWHWCSPVNFAKFLKMPFLTKNPPGAASKSNSANSNIILENIDIQIALNLTTLQKVKLFQNKFINYF